MGLFAPRQQTSRIGRAGQLFRGGVKWGRELDEPIYIGPTPALQNWTEGVLTDQVFTSSLWTGATQYGAIGMPEGVTIDQETGILVGVPAPGTGNSGGSIELYARAAPGGQIVLGDSFGYIVAAPIP